MTLGQGCRADRYAFIAQAVRDGKRAVNSFAATRLQASPGPEFWQTFLELAGGEPILLKTLSVSHNSERNIKCHFASLTGLRAANTELAVTSNNIANVGTTGFKKSKASFGDIFASSPLQNSAGTVGRGVALKGIRQEFSQGSIEFSSNTLDLAISGDSFFPLKSADGQTDIFSRSGAFVLNEQGNVVNGSGQALWCQLLTEWVMLSAMH